MAVLPSGPDGHCVVGDDLLLHLIANLSKAVPADVRKFMSAMVR